MSRNNIPRLDQLPPDTVLGVRSELEEWIVKEAYACTEPNGGSEAWHWTEYRLQERASGATAWLVVEYDDEAWDVSLYTRPVAPADIGYERGQAFEDEVTLEGQRFVLKESGKLVATKVGTSTSYRGQYADYARGDGQLLSVEAYPDPSNTPRETDIEAWAGHSVDPRSLEVYTADATGVEHRVPQALPATERDQPVRPAPSSAAARLQQQLRGADGRPNPLLLAAVVLVIVILVLVIAQ
jgi:hypothetical protein